MVAMALYGCIYIYTIGSWDGSCDIFILELAAYNIALYNRLLRSQVVIQKYALTVAYSKPICLYMCQCVRAVVSTIYIYTLLFLGS